mmetsp:Transcript_19573/g.34911  ORF Transcript_19573/g.34911 Transcript_19573/m.34911 type:complete len:300 (-) Transcript_19573:53-952(-)
MAVDAFDIAHHGVARLRLGQVLPARLAVVRGRREYLSSADLLSSAACYWAVRPITPILNDAVTRGCSIALVGRRQARPRIAALNNVKLCCVALLSAFTGEDRDDAGSMTDAEAGGRTGRPILPGRQLAVDWCGAGRCQALPELLHGARDWCSTHGACFLSNSSLTHFVPLTASHRTCAPRLPVTPGGVSAAPVAALSVARRQLLLGVRHAEAAAMPGRVLDDSRATLRASATAGRAPCPLSPESPHAVDQDARSALAAAHLPEDSFAARVVMLQHGRRLCVPVSIIDALAASRGARSPR